jgi:hypothetical protein
MKFDINTARVSAFAKELSELHRSAFPVAVRGTLNNAAFDVKQNTMPKSAKDTFIQRQPNFFKANSKVDMAKGFNVESMQATVGFKPLSGTNKAVDDLEQQEYGGNIGGRSFVPLKEARGGDWKKKPRSRYRISDIKNKIIDSKKSKGKNDKEKFIKAAIHAGKGGFVLGNKTNSSGNKFLFKINSVKRLKGGNTVINSTPIFAVEKNRKVKPKATHFMQKASLKSANDLEKNFAMQAEKQIKKYLK